MRKIRNWIRIYLIRLRIIFLRTVWGFSLSDSVQISFSAFLDKTNPGGIEIGEKTLIARGAIILSHDYSRSLNAVTKIGSYCMIGTNAIVLPGITIGDHVVVGAGSIVTKDIDANSMVAGNPARLLKKIKTGAYGKILEYKL